MSVDRHAGAAAHADVLGASPARPDGIAKTQGAFAFSSDLGGDGVLWGATLRSPHPYARIVRDRRGAGVEDRRRRGRDHGRRRARQADLRADRSDQPVFASDVVRYVGEPVAAVAADHPETCRRALAAIVVEYEVLDPVLDPEAAIAGTPDRSTPTATCCATSGSCCGDQSVTGAVVVEGTYEIGMQDQAFLGLEAALAIPDDGGARRRAAHRHPMAARGPQADRRLPRPARGPGAARARRRRRRVRRPRGHLAPGPHLPAGAASRAPSADALQPGGELPRPRPPPPGDDLDAPPRHGRGRDRQDRGPLRARRWRLRLDVVGRAAQRDHPHARAVSVRERRRRGVGGTHQPPAVRRDARASGWSRPASPTSRSSTSWPRRAGSTRSRSACATRSAPAIA